MVHMQRRVPFILVSNIKTYFMIMVYTAADIFISILSQKRSELSSVTLIIALHSLINQHVPWHRTDCWVITHRLQSAWGTQTLLIVTPEDDGLIVCFTPAETYCLEAAVVQARHRSANGIIYNNHGVESLCNLESIAC